MQSEEMRLDGNALAGPLRDVFAFEPSVAEVTCAGCGTTGPMATLLVYAHGMGLVARCPACERVLLRLSTPHDAAVRHCFLEMSGVGRLRLPLPS